MKYPWKAVFTGVESPTGSGAIQWESVSVPPLPGTAGGTCNYFRATETAGFITKYLGNAEIMPTDVSIPSHTKTWRNLPSRTSIWHYVLERHLPLLHGMVNPAYRIQHKLNGSTWKASPVQPITSTVTALHNGDGVMPVRLVIWLGLAKCGATSADPPTPASETPVTSPNQLQDLQILLYTNRFV